MGRHIDGYSLHSSLQLETKVGDSYQRQRLLFYVHLKDTLLEIARRIVEKRKGCLCSPKQDMIEGSDLMSRSSYPCRSSPLPSLSPLVHTHFRLRPLASFSNPAPDLNTRAHTPSCPSPSLTFLFPYGLFRPFLPSPWTAAGIFPFSLPLPLSLRINRKRGLALLKLVTSCQRHKAS